MRKLFYLAWALVALGLFVTAALAGYSPFGDGRQDRNVYAAGGGPRHK